MGSDSVGENPAKGRKRKRSRSKVEGSKMVKSSNQVVVNIPVTAKDCSANWKKLLTEMKNEKSAKKKEVLENTMKNNWKDKHKNKVSERKSKQRTINDKKPDIWFDDVEPEDIEAVEKETNRQESSTDRRLVKHNAFAGLTKAVGMDCEMVGVGQKGSHSILARVSLVNQFGKCIYDKHVKPREDVTDYRTWVSGIRPSDLKGAEDFLTVQREVAEILKGRILVGHALKNDLNVLYLTHPKKMIRDTAEYKPFREYNKGRTPSLKHLSNEVLGVQVQKGEHSSVQDAQAAMRLYTMHKKQWEKEMKVLKDAKRLKKT